MSNKETPKEAGLTYVGKLYERTHIFEDSDGNYSVWGCNKHHASYGLIWRNTHLEFCRTASNEEIKIAQEKQPQ